MRDKKKALRKDFYMEIYKTKLVPKSIHRMILPYFFKGVKAFRHTVKKHIASHRCAFFNEIFPDLF